jgi:uncharacterized protein
MTHHKLQLFVLPNTFAVSKFPAQSALPPWLDMTAPHLFLSITRTDEELSIVCEDALIPTNFSEEATEKGWSALKVQGPLEFSMTGVMATLSAALAAVGISLFAISTYNTDYLLVRHESLERAIRALQNAGHTIHEEALKR